MLERKSDIDTPAEITEALKIFDKEGNGYLPASELKHILCNIGKNIILIKELFSYSFKK